MPSQGPQQQQVAALQQIAEQSKRQADAAERQAAAVEQLAVALNVVVNYYTGAAGRSA